MNDHVKIVNKLGGMWIDYPICELAFEDAKLTCESVGVEIDLDDISLLITYELDKPHTEKTIYEVNNNGRK